MYGRYTDSTWVMVDSSHIKTNTNGKQYNILVYVNVVVMTTLELHPASLTASALAVCRVQWGSVWKPGYKG